MVHYHRPLKKLGFWKLLVWIVDQSLSLRSMAEGCQGWFHHFFSLNDSMISLHVARRWPNTARKKNNLNFCHCGSGLLWIISERCKPYSIPMWGVSSTNAMCFLMSSICTSTRGQRKLEKNTKEATTFFAQGCISQMQSTPQKTSFFRLNFCSTFKVSSKIWDNLQTLLDTRTQRGQPCWKQVTSRFHHLGDSKVANFSPSNLLSNH